MSERKFFTKAVTDLRCFEQVAPGRYAQVIGDHAVIIEMTGGHKPFRLGPLTIALGRGLDPTTIYYTITMDGVRIGTRPTLAAAIKFAEEEASE